MQEFMDTQGQGGSGPFQTTVLSEPPSVTDIPRHHTGMPPTDRLQKHIATLDGALPPRSLPSMYAQVHRAIVPEPFVGSMTYLS